MTDIIVAGAGPAGSIAALVLARAGVKVRLLDRAQFPRDKLCGDTLNPGSLHLLDGLGIQPQGLAISGMTVTGPGGAAVSADYPGGITGLALTRRDLDLLLVEAAVAAGACLETGVAVREPLVEDGRVLGVRVSNGRRHELRAPLVIAADGRASRIGAALGLSRLARTPRRWAFGAYFDGVTALTSRGEMHVRRGGYIGVAPLPGGIANVCVVKSWGPGLSWGPASAGPLRLDQERVIEDAVAADPLLRGRFTHATRISPVTALGPLAVDATAAGCPGLLLAGDAAGFVDPMTGDGLRFALRGAQLAAEAALRELSSGVPAFGELNEWRRREFTAKWRLNRGLRALVSSPRGVGVAASIARYWPAPVEQLIRIAGDIDVHEPRRRGGTE